jgi:hypothetical protein
VGCGVCPCQHAHANGQTAMTFKLQQSVCRSRVEKARKIPALAGSGSRGNTADALPQAQTWCSIATAMPLATPTVSIKPLL